MENRGMFRDRQSDRCGALRSAELHRRVSTLCGMLWSCSCKPAWQGFALRPGCCLRSLLRRQEHHSPAPCFLSPCSKCVICSPAYSGPCLAAQRCCSPGPGGGAVISVGPVIFIRNTAVLQGNRRLARSDHHLCSAVSDSRESPW